MAEREDMAREGDLNLGKFFAPDAKVTDSSETEEKEAEESTEEQQEETESEEDVETDQESDSDPDALDEPEEEDDEPQEDVDDEPEEEPEPKKASDNYKKRYNDSQAYIKELQRQNQLLLNQTQQQILQQGESSTTDEDEFDFLDGRSDDDFLSVSDLKKLQKARAKAAAKKPTQPAAPNTQLQTAYINSHKNAERVSHFIEETGALTDPELATAPTDTVGKYFLLEKKMFEQENSRLKAENKKLANQIKLAKKKRKNKAPVTGPQSRNFVSKGRKSEYGKDAVDKYFSS